MKDEDKTKEQLIDELTLLRQRIAELERTESECKQVEQALRNSQERLNLALKSSKAGTWDRDIAADKATWDEHLHALFGLVPGTFSGKLDDFLGMLLPDDRERVMGEMTAAMDGDADYATTYRVVWPDSSVHVLADRGKVYRDNQGRPVRMVGVNLDVTELKQTEEALRESQQQLADIINFLPDATFVIDKEGKVISWNRAIEEMTGIKAEDMLGSGNYEYALPFHGARRPILTHKRLLQAGANRVVSPFATGAQHIAQNILRPTVTDFLELALSAEGLELSMEEILVPDGAELVGKKLMNTGIRSDYNLIVVAIKRHDGTMIFNPSPMSGLQPAIFWWPSVPRKTS